MVRLPVGVTHVVAPCGAADAATGKEVGAEVAPHFSMIVNRFDDGVDPGTAGEIVAEIGCLIVTETVC